VSDPAGPSPCRKIDILLVEDVETDVELIIRVLKRGGVINDIHVGRDGQEALDYLFGRGAPLAAGGIVADGQRRMVEPVGPIAF
jgi:CheY-like chemotaxis protein